MRVTYMRPRIFKALARLLDCVPYSYISCEGVPSRQAIELNGWLFICDGISLYISIPRDYVESIGR